MSTYYLEHHPHTWLYFPPLTLSVGILTFRSIYQYASEGKAPCSEVLAVTNGEGFITLLVSAWKCAIFPFLPSCVWDSGSVQCAFLQACWSLGYWWGIAMALR